MRVREASTRICEQRHFAEQNSGLGRRRPEAASNTNLYDCQTPLSGEWQARAGGEAALLSRLNVTQFTGRGARPAGDQRMLSPKFQG